MNKYIIDTSHFQLERKDSSEDFTLTVFDKYGHFSDSFYIDKEELCEIRNSLENLNEELNLC